MIRTKDILDEKDPRVRAKNSDVEFPLCNEYKDIIPEMLKHLRYSQIEKLSNLSICSLVWVELELDLKKQPKN